MVSTYRVAVLGARGVGKSAIVRQFLYNEFSEVCVPTTARRLYLPAVVMNGHVHDLQILDFPPISAFPVNTLQVGGHGVGPGQRRGWALPLLPALRAPRCTTCHLRALLGSHSFVHRFIQQIFEECGSGGKESSHNAGDPGSIPGLGRSPGEGNGNPLQLFLPGEFHGRRSLTGYSGVAESDTTERLTLSL